MGPNSGQWEETQQSCVPFSFSGSWKTDTTWKCGNVLSLPLSSWTTRGNSVLHNVPKNLPLGADAGLLMVWECNLVLGHVAGTCWGLYGLCSGFIKNVIHTPVSYLSALAACELASSAAITAALVVMWAEPWDIYVFCYHLGRLTKISLGLQLGEENRSFLTICFSTKGDGMQWHEGVCT